MIFIFFSINNDSWNYSCKKQALKNDSLGIKRPHCSEVSTNLHSFIQLVNKDVLDTCRTDRIPAVMDMPWSFISFSFFDLCLSPSWSHVTWPCLLLSLGACF